MFVPSDDPVRPDQWAAKEALRAHHRELVKLPLQDLLPDLFSDGLITVETQERILHPRAVFIKREANQLILQDVRQAVSSAPEYLDNFLKCLQSLQPAVGLSQRIRGTYPMVGYRGTLNKMGFSYEHGAICVCTR